MKFGTKIIHSGLQSDLKPSGAVITPIYQTSTYIQKVQEIIWAMNTQGVQILLERRLKKI